MSRRRTEDENEVSLFPFLSVLACIIGTLTLMIVASALGQMDNETVVTSEQYERVQQELTKVRADLDQLKKQTTGDANQRLELALARASFGLLEERLAAIREEADTEAAESMPAVDLKALEQELTRLQEQIEQLEQLVEERNRPLKEAEVVIQPGGSGIDIAPWFVECRSDSIVIYSDGEPRRIPKSQITGDASFLDLLKKVARNRRASVIFLVRSDGIGTYSTARGVARKHYAKNGKLPVLGQGRIDLSRFEPES